MNSDKWEKVNNEINDFYGKMPCIKIKDIKPLEKIKEICYAKYVFVSYEMDGWMRLEEIFPFGNS